MSLEEYSQLFLLSPSETTPILLSLVRQQASRRKAASLVEQFERDGFVSPSMLDQRTIHTLDGFALEAAAGFEAVQLSPVAPLGTCAAVAATSQDRTLSTTRGTEVVSDPTNVLALECARRLKRHPKDPVRLCTIHQVLRAQSLPKRSGFSRHFRLFALAEAGPGLPEDAFEVDAITRHQQTFQKLFDLLGAMGCVFPKRRVVLYSSAQREVLAGRVRASLHQSFPGVELSEERFESAYYEGLRVLLWAEATSGEHVPIADTGVFDWMGKLTANQKMRFVASGLGIQLAPLLFKPLTSST